MSLADQRISKSELEHPMPHPIPSRFPQTLLALAIGTMLAPPCSWALDFANAPPGTVDPYVAPNVIISLDDSGSMGWAISSKDTRTRMTVLKSSVKEVFEDTTLLPNGKIRLAWQSMWNNGNSPGAGSVNSGSMQQNSMRPLDDTHRANFLAFINGMKANNGTPTHKMVTQADAYLRRDLGTNSPWASKPGTQGEPYLGCRRNYHILLTDGEWNQSQTDTNPANFDGTKRTLPDGTAYGDSAVSNNLAQTRLYRDAETTSTIADWAFKSWADPLQPESSLEGKLALPPLYNNAPASETFKNRVTGATATLNKYWNPRYNPATWAHMVTYTIGYSADALPEKNYNSSGADKGAITAPTSTVPYGYDGNFADYVNGTYVWRAVSNDRGHDMWHAALNSRGLFYAVETGDDLKKAFREIVQQINTETEPDRGSTATSGSNATRNDVGRFTANYDPEKFWKGSVVGELVKKDQSTVPNPDWQGKTTADRLDELSGVDNRLILSWNNTLGKGVPFKWTSIDTTQQLHLQRSSGGADEGAAKGENRLKYLRGDRSMEGKASPANYTTTKPFRERQSRQGDIVNSEVWYVGAPVSNYALKGYAAFTRANKERLPMIYVGGNDGMLHGFSAKNGAEKIAYVPRGVIPALGRLSDPEYNNRHQYYVDGSPMTGDVDVGVNPDDPAYVPNWRTMLVGTLGAGGKGYFLLDVTTPGTSTDEAGNFTEANAGATTNPIVVMDKTRHASETVANVADCENTAITPAANREACLAAADIGHIFAKPVMDEVNPQRTTQITRLNNNRWAVVMGNGYNSKSGRPVLLIQYLDGDQKLLRLVTTGTTTTANCVTDPLKGNSCANITDNGLSAPRLVDINGDGRPDVVYAGDNKGNLWKFLVASDDDTKWGVAQWGSNANTTNNHTTTGTPLYTAKGGTEGSPNSRTLPQPITTAPTVRANDRKKEIDGGGGKKEIVAVGGMMVAFGTGRNVTKLDPQDPNKQTLYSVLDNTRYKLVGTKKDRVEVCTSTTDDDCKKLLKTSDDLPAPVTVTASGPGPLAKQEISSAIVNTRDGRDFWTVDVGTALDWTVHKGWYLDLPQTGERLLKPMGFYDGSNLLTVFSQVPAQGSRTDANVESCESGAVQGEKQYLTLLNIMDGKRPSVQIMDTNGNGTYDLSSDQGASRISTTKGDQTTIKVGDKITLYGDKDPKTGQPRKDDLAVMPEESLRPSWRQLR